MILMLADESGCVAATTRRSCEVQHRMKLRESISECASGVQRIPGNRTTNGFEVPR